MRVSKIACLSMMFGWMLGGSTLAQAASSVKVSWSIPTTRENGKALTASELSGYELYYTTDNPAVTGTIKISGGSTSTYTVQNLAAGNYHFAMAAVDANGLKSKLSTLADVTLAASTAAPSVPSSSSAVIVSTTSGTGIKASWIAPTTRTDGAPLSVSELSGYKINLRSFFGAWALNTNVSGSVNSYVIPNVTAGFYVIEMAAIDTSGKQSASVYQYVYLR